MMIEEDIQPVPLYSEQQDLQSVPVYTMAPNTFNELELDEIQESIISSSTITQKNILAKTEFKFYSQHEGGLILYTLKDQNKNPLYKIFFNYDGASMEDVNNSLLGEIQVNFNLNKTYDIGLFFDTVYSNILLSKTDINTYTITLLKNNQETIYCWSALPKGTWRLSLGKESIALFKIPKRKANKLGVLTFEKEMDFSISIVFCLSLSFVLHNHHQKNKFLF